MKKLVLLGIVLRAGILFAQDVSLDKKLGAENALMVEQEIGLYRHDSLQQLVSNIGQKLVSRLTKNPFEFKFFLADSPEPNAFALPGGYIYVTRGILPIVQTEDELAGIIAHEIIHVMQRHSVKQMKKGIVPNLLKIPGNLINTVTGTQLGNVLNAPIELTSKAFIANYSRGHESEADRFGVQLTASAGYNPAALADALNRLSKEIELMTGQAEQHSYFSDHPYTPSRESAIRSSAPKYKPVNPSPIAKSQSQFLSRFNGLCFGNNPQQGVFSNSVFIQPDLGFSWIIPSAWKTINKPTVVAAFAEKGDGLVALRLTDGKKTPHALGEEAKEKAVRTEGTQVLAAHDTTLHSLPAYILRMKTTNGKNEALVELVWLDFKNNVIQLAGMSTLALRNTMHQSVCSFRNSTDQEKEGVLIFEMHIARSGENETLASVSERTQNRLNPEFTSLINNLSHQRSLEKGQAIKVVKARPYRPH
ncbi:MAG: M48 family metalloprotease [Cyclobacteriaceae bacterium]|nr:M48 family metalloprotease [Cyclobacteriaceae bacterium]